MPQGDDTESSLVRYSALLRESWLSFQVGNNAQRIYGIWSSSHRTCNAQVVQVNSREEFGILHIEYSHRVSRGTTIQSYAAPSSSPILFVSYLHNNKPREFSEKRRKISLRTKSSRPSGPVSYCALARYRMRRYTWYPLGAICT